MAQYLIKGEQIDGEHEYRIFSIMESDKMPENEEAQRYLIEMHAFGFDQEDGDYDQDDFNTYGDGLTSISLLDVAEIPSGIARTIENYL